MANKQIKDYSEESTMVAGDWFLVQKGTTNATNKVSASNILPAGSVGTVDIANDAVTATKIDWASTGVDGGIWWEELGRTTLGSEQDTISVSSFSARKYLRVLISILGTGTIDTRITFNSDSAANYNYRYSANGAADTAATSTNFIIGNAGSASAHMMFDINIINNQSNEKLVWGSAIRSGTAGAANSAGKDDFGGKWANTSAQITTITLTNVTGSAGYLTNSQMVVLGHN